MCCLNFLTEDRVLPGFDDFIFGQTAFEQVARSQLLISMAWALTSDYKYQRIRKFPQTPYPAAENYHGTQAEWADTGAIRAKFGELGDGAKQIAGYIPSKIKEANREIMGFLFTKHYGQAFLDRKAELEAKKRPVARKAATPAKRKSPETDSGATSSDAATTPPTKAQKTSP